MVADIQRELLRHGFYDGAADGVYGPKTDTAIRDFEQAAGLRPSAEPNDMLLASIARSAIKAQPVAIQRNDPIAALLAPSGRIVAVQRALTDFGYGPVKPTGIYDTETRAAIERFEKARRRPVTGQISDQLVRDLAALTGRPFSKQNRPAGPPAKTVPSRPRAGQRKRCWEVKLSSSRSNFSPWRRNSPRLVPAQTSPGSDHRGSTNSLVSPSLGPKDWKRPFW